MNIKLIASEIVRAMTPAKLEKKQEEYLLHCAQIVIEKYLRGEVKNGDENNG